MNLSLVDFCGFPVDLVNVKLVKESTFLFDQEKIESPFIAYRLGKLLFDRDDREKLVMCCLDTQNRPVAIHTVSIGTLNSSLVSPREIFKTAILANAAGIILFHNHPSGDLTLSQEDLMATKRVIKAGSLIGIPLRDHLVVSDSDFVSIRESQKIVDWD